MDSNNPSCSYQTHWMEWIYAEINSWNQAHAASGEGIYRCVNMYRWCAGCDPWNIDGAPQEAQILTDLDAAVAQKYRWPDASLFTNTPPTGANLAPYSSAVQVDSVYGPQFSGTNAIDGTVSIASRWVSAGTAPPHWLALDLGGDRTVNGFIIHLAGAAGEPATYNAEALSIQTAGSLAGPWNTDGAIDNSARVSVLNRSYMTPKTLRYVRLYITDAGTDNYARIPEFEVWGVLPGYRGDMDSDRDVDQADFGLFQACYATVGTVIPPACTDANLDGDDAIGQSDLVLFNECLSGAGVTPAASCLR